jgi:hypothetical protein
MVDLRFGAIVPVAEHDFSCCALSFGGDAGPAKAGLDPVREFVSFTPTEPSLANQTVKVVCHGEKKVIHL